MRYVFLIILVAALVYNLPKLLHRSTLSDEVIKDDFYFLTAGDSSGTPTVVKNPDGWQMGKLRGYTGDYQVRIADFKITRKPPEISTGAFGIKGEKIFSVEVYKKIERDYHSIGEAPGLRDLLPKAEASRIRCYYYKTKEGKWVHTPEVRLPP